MLREEGETFAAVVEGADRSANVEYRNISLDNVGIRGRSYEYALTDTFGLQTGRYFSILESRRNRAVALVGADTDRREHGCIAHHRCLADFFVSGIQGEIADFAERPLAPGFQLGVQELGGAADLA